MFLVGRPSSFYQRRIFFLCIAKAFWNHRHCRWFSLYKKAAPAPVPAAPQTAGEVTPELVAAVSAALAEELGTDITGIRIVSMKKV